MTTLTVDLSPLYGVLAIDGPEAATFLQGQATCDARLVTPERGALGALCNLQGRMIVSFFVLAAPDGLRLVMPRDRVAPVLQHLKKYAVFARVMLRDASDERAVIGLLGTGADAALAALAGRVPAEPHAAIAADAVTALRLRGKHRFLLLAAAPGTIAGGVASDVAHWKLAAIHAGEILVDSAGADRYLPQALNYDVIDGVSFRKGCYTGQEVVARMHFKGKMKERLYLAAATLAAAPAANTIVVDAGGKHVGDVVDAAVIDGKCALAAVIRHDAVRAGGLALGNGGPALDVHAPPYPLPEEPA